MGINRKKIAIAKTIEFNAPRNALMYLSNNTLKKRGKTVFIIKNNVNYYNIQEY